MQRETPKPVSLHRAWLLVAMPALPTANPQVASEHLQRYSGRVRARDGARDRKAVSNG